MTPNPNPQAFYDLGNGVFKFNSGDISLYGANGADNAFTCALKDSLPVGLYGAGVSPALSFYPFHHKRFTAISDIDSSLQFLSVLFPHEGNLSQNPITFVDSVQKKYVVRVDSPFTTYYAVSKDSAHFTAAGGDTIRFCAKFAGVQLHNNAFRKILLNNGNKINKNAVTVFETGQELESIVAAYDNDSLIIQTYSEEEDYPVYKILHQGISPEAISAKSVHHVNTCVPPSNHIQNLAFDSLYFYVNYFTDTSGVKHISNDITFAYGNFYSEIIVDSGTTLNFHSMAASGKSIHLTHPNFIVDGSINIRGSEQNKVQIVGFDNNNFTLRSSCSAIAATNAVFTNFGIRFGLLDLPAVRQCEIDSCIFITNNEAIKLYSANISISNSRFENCQTAINGDLCSGSVQNCTIKNGTKGIRFNQSSVVLSGDSIINNLNYGIYLSFCDDFSLQNLVVENNGIFSGETDWPSRSGILLYASSPTLNDNIIRYNNGNGILAFASSYPFLCEEYGEQNCIQDNGNTIAQSGNSFEEAEIYFYNESWPIMDYGHNDILDVRDDLSCLLFGSNNSIESIHCDGNFWGLNYLDISDRLLPSGEYLYSPYDEEQNNAVTNPGKPPERILLFSGMESESNGDYNSAWSDYSYIINLYPATAEAQIALNRKFTIAQKRSVNYSSLKTEFLQIIQDTTKTNLHTNAYRYAYQCDIKNNNCRSGIEGYQFKLANAGTLTDSFYAQVEIITTERLTGYKNINTTLSKSVQSTDLHMQSSELLLGKLAKVVNRKLGEAELVPNKYKLFQNYPNPFNPSTTIRWQLPEKSCVHLDIFNMLGQEITSLVNRTTEPGIHKVKWNGYNSSGRPVGNGVYILRLTAKPLNGSTKYTESKKLLLIR